MPDIGYWDYLTSYAKEALSIAREGLSLIVGSTWGLVQAKLAGFWFTSALFWLSIFWLVDFLLGSGRAIAAGQWRARRALLSGAKLATGCLVLMTAHAMRDSSVGGHVISQAVASLLEAVVLLAEFSSVLIHAGTLSDSKIVLRLGLAFRRGSSRAADRAMALIDGKKAKKEEERRWI